MGRTHLFASAFSLCVCLTAFVGPAWPQATSPPTAGGTAPSVLPGRALKNGINLYRNNEYEQADREFKIAQQSRNQLSEKDRRVLDDYQAQTSIARREREQASALLKQAEAQVESGNTQSANELLRKVSSKHRYLAVSDRNRVDALETKLRPTRKGPFWTRLLNKRNDAPPPPSNTVANNRPTANSGVNGAMMPASADMNRGANNAGTASSPPVPTSMDDAKTLVSEGRGFLARGNLDYAEKWALTAKQYRGKWFFGDNPDRLLNDIATARIKTNRPNQGNDPMGMANRNAPNGTRSAGDSYADQFRRDNMPGARTQDGINGARTTFNPVSMSGQPAASTSTTAATATTANKPVNAPNNLSSVERRRRALFLLEQAKSLIRGRRFNEAEALLEQARSMDAVYQRFDDTPDTVALMLRNNRWVPADAAMAQRGREEAPDKSVTPVSKPTAPTTAPTPTNNGTTSTISRQRIVPPPPAAIAQKAPAVLALDNGAMNSVDTQRKREATAMVVEARSAFDAEDYVRAVSLAQKAKTLNATFAPGEDSPEKILAAHEAMRLRMQDRRKNQVAQDKLTEARRLMKLAHQHLYKRHYDQAAEFCKQAVALNAPYGLEDERPDDLLRHVESMQLQAVAVRQAKSGPELSARQPVPVPEVRGEMPIDTKVRPVSELAMEPGTPNPVRLPVGTGNSPMAENPAIPAPGASGAELFEAGMNAYGRRDYETAHQCFTLAAKYRAALKPEQWQAMQERMALLAAQGVGQAPAKGRARATDQGVQFAQAQQTAPDPNDADAPDNADLANERDAIARARRSNDVQVQKLRHDTITALQQASRLRETDPEAAIRQLQTALDAVQISELDRDLTAPFVRQLQGRIRQYRVLAVQSNDQKLLAQRAKSQVEQRVREDNVSLQKQQQIKQLSNRYNDLMNQGKYREAQAVAYQITEIDPDELFGQAGIMRAEFFRHHAVINDLETRKQDAWWEALKTVEEAAIPFPDEPPITYIDARAWEELTYRRQKYKVTDLRKQTDADRKIQRSLDRPVSFDFNETPLEDVVNFLRDFTEVNIILDQKGLDAASIQRDQPITLAVKDVSLRSALNLLLSQFELTYLTRNEVLLITDKQETGAQLETRVYPVADLVIPVQNFGSGLGGLGGFGGGGGGGGLGGGLGGGGGGLGGGGGGLGGGGGGLGGGGGGLGGGLGGGGGGGGFGGGLGGAGGGGLGNQQQGANVAQEVIDLIINTVAFDTWQDNGGDGTIDYFSPNNSFVIRQTPDVHDQVADLLDQLRRLQDLQVTVEVRFITVNEQFFERIGIDFDVSFDNNNDRYLQDALNNQLQPPGLPGINLTNQMGLPTGNHERGVTIGRTSAGSPTFDFNVPLSQSSFENAAIPLVAGLDPLMAGAAGGSNIGIAFLNDIDVFLLLEAVQGDRRSTTLNAPKVTLFNGQSALVFVGRLVPFVVDAVPVVVNGAVAFDPTIAAQLEGTILQVQAVVSADRRYVRMNLQPQITQLEPLDMVRNVPIQATAGGGAVGTTGGVVGVSGTATVNVQLPITNVTAVFTSVSVPDGGTVLLGGVKTHAEARNEFGTPVLSKIPYLNRLFKNSATSRVTNSLLLMVTPRIIIPEEEEEDLLSGRAQRTSTR